MAQLHGRFSSLLDSLLADPAFKGFIFNSAEIRKAKGEIGNGTYGKVFQVNIGGNDRIAKELHQKFVIKGKNLTSAKESVKKFRLSAQHDHGNIVRLFGIYENKMVQPSTLNFVMEKMNCSLTSLLESGSKISNSTKLSILLDVSLGLEYLHSQNPPVAHGYLSSSNILLTAEQKAKISDIGLVQLVTSQGKKIESSKCLPFMAPEVRKSNFGLPADVFSYGMVIIHTITERQLAIPTAKQPKLDYASQIDQIGTDAFFKQLKELVIHCLRPDANSRPQITLTSQMIKMMLQVSGALPIHNHGEVEQPLKQVQPASSGMDPIHRSPTIDHDQDLTIEKSVPTIPYTFEKHGPKVIVS